jgi:DNA-binding NtrC family response regulator
MDGKTILVIDDESDTRVYLFDLLRSEGYRVVTFENPYDALTQVHRLRPDAVILDVKMPQVNGVDFLPTLRTAAPDTPVLILTAYANLELFMQAREKGASEMMCKPFSGSVLLKTLRRVLGEAPQEGGAGEKQAV